VVVAVAKAFGYERGAVNYFFGSLTGNILAMYIFGSGLLAMWEAVFHSVGGSFVEAALSYFLTKYLPPTSVNQVVAVLVVGAGVAALKWYVFTPRQG
jgi:hypothetical protein